MGPGQHGCGLSVQHGQGVAFVVAVFKAGNNRRRGADELRKLRLSEVCGGPQAVDLTGNFFVRSSLFEILQPRRFPGIEPAAEDLQRVG